MTGIIGVLELQNVSDGYLALDAMVKAAPVSIIRAEIVNPGKYLILVTGDVASAEIAMDAGITAAVDPVVDHLLITSLDEQVLPALMSVRPPAVPDAVGIVESVSVAGAINAADRAAKAVEVDIVSIKAGSETGGRGILTLNGNISNVQSAVEAAAAGLQAKGMLLRSAVITGPHPDTKRFFNGN